MDNWNEIRTAATVARLQTISAAAEALGVHRATVTRHIDALETELGAKLFQRHARGFTPTELGQELLRIADATGTQFGELVRLARGSEDELHGEIVITCLDVLVPYILPKIALFQTDHPGMDIRMISSDKKLKLEYGEADMAFRIGPKPDHPDNVVLDIGSLGMGLFASQSYLNANGKPNSIKDFALHRFVGVDASAPDTPYLRWLGEAVPTPSINVKVNSVLALWEAVGAGLGIGFHPLKNAADKNLVSVWPAQADWHETIWAVSHMDLHRTAKVQALARILRSTQ